MVDASVVVVRVVMMTEVVAEDRLRVTEVVNWVFGDVRGTGVKSGGRYVVIGDGGSH